MQTITEANPFARASSTNSASAKRAPWGGRIISGLAVAFLIFDSVGKLLRVQPVIDGTMELGYPPDVVFSLGVILLSSVLA